MTTKAESRNAVALPKALRVLFVEDCAQDVKLTARMLERAGGYNLTFDAVDTPAALRRQLEQTDYEVVISDYNLGSWTAIEALQIVKKSGKTIPFIVVSGSLGDEAAVECIRQGATDYVLKDRMARLPSAVERALDEKRSRDERQGAEEKLRQSEEQFRLISESVADLIAVVDLEGKRVYNSPSYKGILGDPEDLRGTVSFNEIHPDDRENIKRVFEDTIRTGVGQRAEYRFMLKDGSIRFVESQGSVIRDSEGKPARVVVVSRDITERKQLEEQLRQSQKMEAVGQLAGGAAHDFNNLLTVIKGYSELLLEHLAETDSAREQVTEIQKAADRAASLTRQLLAFSRRQVLQPQVLDLNTIVANTQKMLQRLIGEDIALVARLVPELGRVRADPGQIEQIILNLAVNARDAMPQGGTLTLETANIELDEAYARGHVAVTPGLYVMLAVSDSGIGMNAETKSRIFEPFFTTKEKGKGTGLGLATVYGIVKQSGGNIWVYSEPGHGTTFKIYLPRVEDAIETVEPAKSRIGVPRGSETVLLVEDEEAVRALVRGVLQAKGYKVLEASQGDEAWEILGRHKGPIHLLVTDVVMPAMSGGELAKRLAAQHPEMKVLYMSGYTDHSIVHHGVLDDGLAFLQKPFTRNALARKVREVLDAG